MTTKLSVVKLNIIFVLGDIVLSRYNSACSLVYPLTIPDK